MISRASLTFRERGFSTNTSFPATGSWETWGVVEKEVTLNAGANTVRAQTTGVSGANMDRLDVSAVVTTDRFVDNGDGTVTDTYTGLMWEKKIPDLGAGTGEWSIHEVDKSYYYTAPENSVNAPTGTVFTDFLARLNYSRFAGYTDWRIPSGVEARSLYSGPDPLGQDCIGAPPYECTHPIFGPDRGTWIVTDAMLGYSYPLDTKISLLCPAPCVPHPGGPPLRYVPCKVRCGNCVFALVGRDAAAFGSPFFISTEL